jgi:hypothetical protein
MKQHKQNCFKVRWGIFFYSTNVETKNVCPIAYNYPIAAILRDILSSYVLTKFVKK